jgi:hypothetical protein
MRRTPFQPNREQSAPKGAIKVTPKGLDLVIYLYTDRAGRPCAMVFGGKRNKPDLHVQYAKPERREQHLKEHIENARRVAEYKSERQAKRQGFRHSFKVGDILHHSWGYEQTNCEFYQVTGTTPGTITIREIAQKTEPGSEISHGMAENRLPVPGNFLDKSEPITKRVQFSESGPGSVPMKHGCCSLWDGRPKYCSWYA